LLNESEAAVNKQTVIYTVGVIALRGTGQEHTKPAFQECHLQLRSRLTPWWNGTSGSYEKCEPFWCGTDGLPGMTMSFLSWLSLKWRSGVLR